MKKCFFLLSLLFFYGGCGNNYYTEADLGTKENYLKYLSGFEGDEVEIVFLDGYEQKINIIEFYPDSLIIENNQYLEKYKYTIYGQKTILMKDIHLIRINSSNFVEGALIGAAAGGLILGAMAPFPTGASNGGKHYGTEQNLGLGATAGGIVGLMVGAFYQKKIEYLINPK